MTGHQRGPVGTFASLGTLTVGDWGVEERVLPFYLDRVGNLEGSLYLWLNMWFGHLGTFLLLEPPLTPFGPCRWGGRSLTFLPSPKILDCLKQDPCPPHPSQISTQIFSPTFSHLATLVGIDNVFYDKIKTVIQK